MKEENFQLSVSPFYMAIPDEDNRWSLQEEIAMVFNTSLKKTFEDPQVALSISTCTKKDDDGDYICSSILDIWPAIRNSRKYKGPKHAGLAIKKNLPDLASNMMERCVVCGPGFVKFKLSRKWIAKRIYTMLVDGIDTWAPKLSVKKAIVDFLSPNIAEEMHMGHLRSAFIGETLARMLEFCGVDVLRRIHVGDHRDIKLKMLREFLIERFPNGEVDDQAIGEIEVLYKESKKRFDEDAEFRERVVQGSDESRQNAWVQLCKIIRERYQKVYWRLGVHVKVEVISIDDSDISKTLCLLTEKGLTKESEGDGGLFMKGRELPLMKRDVGYDLASKYLTAFWHALNVVKADWIVHVSDVGQRDCIEMCITAAERAGWIVSDDSKYPIGHVGFAFVQGGDLEKFRSGSTKGVNLVDLLDEAKSHCKVVLLRQGKADEWEPELIEHTAEALGYGAVKYADLMNNRLTNYTFSFDQMFNEKGNTAVYIQYTYARICSIIRKSDKDIKGSEVEELLKNDKERELGLHLLRFTEVLGDAWKVLMPHILCKYLYDLSEKFNSLYPSVCQDVARPGEKTWSNDETSKLLLCEATEVVMRKCFCLLGIPSIRYL